MLPADTEDLEDDALLAELGIDVDAPPITELKHVRSTAEKKAAEDIANRDRREDFDTFKPLFEQVQNELNSGLRETRPFEMKAEIEKGRFFIVSGQKAYVAEKGETTINDQGRTDVRLRVIFDNGTESSMLMRSLQRALNKDDAGRRITEPTAGPLFSDQTIDGDEASGTIYVLRSKSDHPLVTENRELVHKIGVTNMSVEKRIAGAHLQPTFLMANVEIVATYELYNINRTKLENLVHRIFEPARLEIEIMDRFGRPVVPREWFLVPLFVINEAVEKIKDGSISGYCYDPDSAMFLQQG
ncbi:GIY-YIG nuclease family protein [Sulfitobacter sp. W074]|uniref:GIY-YIG nuclease family protein n=1 Tax=Sulfitobacter sp. W074 TaxID=2867026 RepID=UPI0021A77B57|nr:GIY-YIG nuclease family protein [Sulfitobacter sp. W074]